MEPDVTYSNAAGFLVDVKWSSKKGEENPPGGFLFVIEMILYSVLFFLYICHTDLPSIFTSVSGLIVLFFPFRRREETEVH